jgi:hypothetical protein
MKPSMSQFRCFGGRKTVIIDVRFVLVIPPICDFFFIIVIIICFVFPGFPGCIRSAHLLSGSFEVHGNVGFKMSHSAVSASGTASSSTWSLMMILSASIPTQTFQSRGIFVLA